MQGWLVGLKRRFCCPFCHTVFACVLTGLEANAFTFSPAIKGCERQGCWEAVCGLLLHMKEEGIQENSYTFNAAIGTFGKAQLWPVALSLTKEMVVQKVQSDMITGSTSIDALEAWIFLGHPYGSISGSQTTPLSIHGCVHKSWW